MVQKNTSFYSRNILHKIINEQTLSPTFSWINFTPVFNHNKDSQNEMVQKLPIKQMENLQVIRLEAGAKKQNSW